MMLSTKGKQLESVSLIQLTTFNISYGLAEELMIAKSTSACSFSEWIILAEVKF